MFWNKQSQLHCKQGLILTMCLSLFACREIGDVTETNKGQLQDEMTIAASDVTRMRLGVAAWSIHTAVSEDESLIEARDQNGAKVAGFRVRTDEQAPDEVHFLGESPESGEVVLLRDGRVLGSASKALNELALALSKDAAIGTLAVTERSKAEDSDRGQAVESSTHPLTNVPMNDRSIAYDGFVSLSGGVWGSSNDWVKGGACKGGHTRTAYEARISDGSGNCYVRRWLSSDPYDCRIVLHFGQKAFRGGTCYWAVYQDGSDY